jgi:superfamily I DNA/RNA helicase
MIQRADRLGSCQVTGKCLVSPEEHDPPMSHPEVHLAVAERMARLAPDQRAAATAPPGPVLCVAPAGSGKTTTLVARIAWRIATGTRAAHICALTFNRRAARELQSRLSEALAPLGISPEAVLVGTFHALGREILADGGVDVTRLVDRATLLEEIAGHPLPAAQLHLLEDLFSRYTLDPGAAPAPHGSEMDVAIRVAFSRYRDALRERNALDFDDLVARSLALLREDAGILTRWRDRCGTLFVDEAQDLDRSQLDMALLLAEPDRDIFLVGDDDQTIYAWRLADVRRILGLAAALPGLHRVDLQTNHRCPPEVVRRSARLIEHGAERFAKVIRAFPRATGGLVLAPDTGDPVSRARRVLDAWYGLRDGRYAVLARTNAELAPFAALAIERAIPYSAADDGLLFGDPALDRLLPASLSEAATAPPPVWLAALARALRVPAAGEEVAGRSLVAWAAGFPSARAFATALVETSNRRDELRRDDARLVLATVHTTKGLEFDHVAVIGLDKGTFPNERALSEAPDPARALEEERRLAYVAWTRARHSLLLVYDPGAPSPFMLEAFDPAELGVASRGSSRGKNTDRR